MMDKPTTKGELYREVASAIEHEGFHYALVNYMGPESVNCDELDPELATMWREFVALSEKIAKHVGAEV